VVGRKPAGLACFSEMALGSGFQKSVPSRRISAISGVRLAVTAGVEGASLYKGADISEYLGSEISRATKLAPAIDHIFEEYGDIVTRP
jgi:hypothetical protein